MRLTFCGAARITTGSCYLVEADHLKLLIDCGMFQGTKDITKLNYLGFPFKPADINYVLLTHAHIDHSGLLPKLVREGFSGAILATSATIDLCRIMLEDSASVQEKDTEQENRRRLREGLALRLPLYTAENVKRTMRFFKKIEYNRFVQLSPNIVVCYRDAGHIIGSAIIELTVNEDGNEKKIVFSGDLGQWNVPIINDPAIIRDATYIVIESTYGNRLHENIRMRDDLLLKHAKETYKKGGRLLIPSFAIERTQELLYSFNKLIKEGKFPDEKIFLDSPLAIKATEIFKRHKEVFDAEALYKYKDPFSFANLVYTPDVSDSMKLNEYAKPCVIIAGSGMCTGGRIRHHLKHGLWDSKNKVLFVGYQAQGTTGRYILEGAKTVKMMGMRIAVKADIAKINSFSAHADAKELIRWVDGFEKKPVKVFITHGEERSSIALKKELEKRKLKCHIPKLKETVEI